MPMFKLIIEDDEGKTTVVPLSRDETTVGRKEGNTIRLTERNVSRYHARILKHNGAIYVEDLNSYNGVKVNGNRIAGRVGVAEGDRIQIGDYLLGLKLDRAAEADPFAQQQTEPIPRTRPPGAEMSAAAFDDTAPHGLVDAAPTARVPMPPEAAAVPARLVAISSNFAGQEFLLDKAAVVIGRTEENDIILNHRSISRHHAKIVRDEGHFTIVDLQSANGVRVNGEEYGKVELRRGDLVDLGHVRLRFVEPGEDFVFDRDATALVDMPEGGRSRALLFVGIGVACVAGGAVFALRHVLFGPPVVVAAADAGRAVAPPAVTPPADAALKLATKPDATALAAELDRLMKDERWDEVIKQSDAALAQNPSLDLIRDKRARARVEQRHQDALTVLSEAVDKKDLDRARDAFRKISDDSVYKRRADELWTRVRADYVHAHLARAKRARDDGRCELMGRELDLVQAIDEGNREIARLRRGCKAPAVAVATPPRTPRPPPPPEQPRGQFDDGQAKTLLDQAAASSARGQCAQAINLAQQAVKLTRKAGLLNRANATISLCYCSVGRKDAAQRHANRLDGAWKAQVKSICRSRGVELD